MDEAGNEGDWENPFVGTWQITWMELWDREVIDAEVPGYIRFDEEDTGEFQFAHVRGGIHYRWEISADSATADFSWEGTDEMDASRGRGRAILKGDQMVGKIAFREGDESKFRAERLETDGEEEDGSDNSS